MKVISNTARTSGDVEEDLLEPPIVEHNRFYQSVMMLPSRFQEALVLKYVAGLRIDDVAVVMKLPMAQASVLLSEAHAALMQELNSGNSQIRDSDAVC